jgi:valyl-tRNA synthetase
MSRFLQLLHPYMPHVTEELSLRMGYLEEGEFLMLEPPPVEGDRPHRAGSRPLRDQARQRKLRRPRSGRGGGAGKGAHCRMAGQAGAAP